MKTIFDTYHPEGFRTLNPYLFTQNPGELIRFLKAAFYAEELSRTVNEENGEIANCILKIGDSCFMIGKARGEFEGMSTALYLFVNDVDLVHKNALAHGGISVLEPADMDYQDRQGGIKDPAGNYWWISKRLVNEGY
ncbi:VOC family protein [Muriicola sp. Z0-33]|uniref:VOC family protein n=1 Tax=Muriicola sp. Z0-33 TaxID=2816957 RepID=UPI002238F69F|nr:VOC family protein [Muriicola sp. Z0-33]MCW5515865.1 VOC family protein [Muriicola sp. Z0-33]